MLVLIAICATIVRKPNKKEALAMTFLLPGALELLGLTLGGLGPVSRSPFKDAVSSFGAG